MSNLEKRVEKLEAKLQVLEEETNARKAKLLELKRLEKDDSIAALFLRKELETGRKWTLAQLMLELDGKLPRDRHRGQK